MNHLISVIIPVYNVEKYLDKCIISVLNQTYKNLEIILIDDGSTDNSGLLCDEWSKKDNRIIVKHKENSGVSATRNLGIEIATGDFIGFVDPDDYIDVTMYEKMISASNNGEYDIICCNYYYGDEHNYKINIPIKEYIKMNKKEYQEFSLKYGGQVWNKIYKREYMEGKKFSSNIHVLEDLLFNLDISKDKINVLYIDKPLYYYFSNPTSVLKKDIKKQSQEKILSSLYAQELIIELASNNNLQMLNELKLRYILDAKMKIFLLNIKENDLKHFKSMISIYIKDNIFLKKAPFFLKVKTLIIYKNPKLYFDIKKVLKNENK